LLVTFSYLLLHITELDKQARLGWFGSCNLYKFMKNCLHFIIM